MKPKWPRGKAQWQEAVNLAKAALVVDSARQYGLITGGPEVNVDRCMDFLAVGKGRGFLPDEAEVDRILASFAGAE